MSKDNIYLHNYFVRNAKTHTLPQCQLSPVLHEPSVQSQSTSFYLQLDLSLSLVIQFGSLSTGPHTVKHKKYNDYDFSVQAYRKQVCPTEYALSLQDANQGTESVLPTATEDSVNFHRKYYIKVRPNNYPLRSSSSTADVWYQLA